jgi:hypothetical protein
MTDPLDHVRHEIARARGLGQDATTFLNGTTVTEIERQAGALANLIGTSGDRGEPDPAATPADPISTAIANRQAQKRRLAAMIIGRPEQPRDELGRFASRSVSFDGGARGRPLPTAPSPEQQHDQAILALARLRALGG